MSVYYKDDLVTLYHGDCLTEHTEWTTADVLVTDPPYGVAYQSGRKQVPHLRIASDEDTRARDTALALWGEGRPALVFGSWKKPRPGGVLHRLIWSKGANPGMGSSRMPWGNSDEEIYVMGAGFTGRRESNVLVHNTLPSLTRPDHPTPKPVGLMEKLIVKAPPGVVADPFAGSGATLIAARNLGRECVGVEIEEKYCELIAQRLSQGALQL